ncbi:MAG: hypothetical protein KDC92_01005 [Bacteroidetes bacterium]|nr:hypothetical protein [Bacteroidota bacterium]
MVRRIVKTWPIALAFLLLGLIITGIVTTYFPPLYKAEAILLIEEPYRYHDPQRLILGEQRFNEPGRAYIINEGLRIKDLQNVIAVCDSLQLGVKCFEPGIFFNKELYQNQPFNISVNSPEVLESLNYSLEINAFVKETEEIELTVNGRVGNTDYDHFEIITTKNKSVSIGSLQLTFSPVYDMFQSSFEYLVTVQDNQSTAIALAEEILVEPVQIESSVYRISMVASPNGKAEDIVGALSQIALNNRINDKRKTLKQTLDNIVRQKGRIAENLIERETEIETYKAENAITDTENEGSKLMDEVNRLEGLLLELQSRQEYMQYLQKVTVELNFENNIPLASPSAYGISDGYLNQLVDEFNDLLVKLALLKSQSQNSDPRIEHTQNSLNNKAKIISQTVDGFIASNLIKIENSNLQLRKIRSSIATLPSKELALTRMTRMFTTLDNNYRALNQKQAEVETSLATLSSDIELLERAHNTSVDPYFPDPKLLLALFVFLALLSPFAYLFFKTLFDNKVREVDYVKTHRIEAGNYSLLVLLNEGCLVRNQIKHLSNNLLENANSKWTIIWPASEPDLAFSRFLHRVGNQNKRVGLIELITVKSGDDSVLRFDDFINRKAISQDFMVQKANHWQIGWTPDSCLTQEHIIALKNWAKHFDHVLVQLPSIQKWPDVLVFKTLGGNNVISAEYGKTRIAELVEIEKQLDSEEFSITVTQCPPNQLSFQKWMKLRRTNKLSLFRMFYLYMKSI